MNTLLKYENELKVAILTVTDIVEGESNYFFDYEYELRGKESENLFDFKRARVGINKDEVLMGDGTGEFDLRCIFETICNRVDLRRLVKYVNEAILVVQPYRNYSRNSIDGLCAYTSYPVHVIETDLMPGVLNDGMAFLLSFIKN